MAGSRYELRAMPRPKGHRPRPNARVTRRDRQIVKAYVACDGRVAAVAERLGISRSGLQDVLEKAGEWRRWVAVATLPNCGRCGRPLSHERHQYHRACRRAAERERVEALLVRARKLLARGKTSKQAAQILGITPVTLTRHLPHVALTAEQRRRRGLAPAARVPTPPARNPRRSTGQRKVDWQLVDVPVPRAHRGAAPARLTDLERRAVRAYLACRGDVARVARSARRSTAWLRLVLTRAQVWKRWRKRPAPRPPCAACGRPLDHIRPGTLHGECRRKQRQERQAAWIQRARTLVRRGWSIHRVSEAIGIHASKIALAVRGLRQVQARTRAESDARLKRFARLVKSGMPTREAGERVGYTGAGRSSARARARAKGYLG